MTNGREKNSADLAIDHILSMERDIKLCDPNVIRLIRTATINNFMAKQKGQINDIIFSKNNERIVATTEAFMKECLCVRKSMGI